MGRKKGSLSRKTLAKQLGISLEEYLELEKNGKLEEYRTEHGIVDQDLPRAWHDTVSNSIPNQKLQEHKEEVREELKAKKISKTGKYPAVPTGKTPEPSPDYKPSEKLTTSTKPNITASTKILLPSNSNKREDEGKDKAESVKAVESVKSAFKSDVKDATKSTLKPNEDKRSPKSNEIFCTRCHKLILKDSSFRLILSNMIPGIASYHYSVDDKQVLCYDCAHGLARVIEGYFEDEIVNEINSALASEGVSDFEQEPNIPISEELNTPISEELDDTNIKEMVKPVEDIKPSEDEDLVF